MIELLYLVTRSVHLFERTHGMSLKKHADRFKGKKKLAHAVAEELDRHGLLATAQLINVEKLPRYNGPSTRSGTHRRRLVGPQETTPEVVLNTRMLIACFKELRRGVPAACYARLRAELRQLDMIFTHERDEFEPSAAFAQFISQKLLPLQDAALLAYLAIGIIPVRFIRNPDNDEVYPHVPTWGTYNITIETVLGVPILRFYWTTLPTLADDDCALAVPLAREHDIFNVGAQGTRVVRGVRRSDGSCQAFNGTISGSGFGRYDPTVAIIANLGHDPDYDGTINSVMSSVLSDFVQYSNSMRRDAVVACSRLARPPLVTEYNAALDQVIAKKSIEIGHFVGSNVIAPGAEQTAQRRTEIYERTREQQALQRDQYRMMASTMGSDALESYGVTPDMYRDRCDEETSCTFSEQLGVDEIKIRDDRKATSAFPEPKFRTDIVEAMNENSEAIATAFGLTLSMLKGETTTAKSGTELSTKTLNSTLRVLLQTMSAFMTLVYHHIFLEQDLFDLLADRVRMQPGEALLSARNLFAEGNEALGTRVTYRFTPMMTLESLRFLKARGIIDFATYAQSAVQTQGMSTSDVASLEEPLDEEVGRALDVPEYAQIMKMKTDEKLKEKEIKAGATMKEREMESAHLMKDKELASAKELAEMKPPPAKKSKKKE